MLELVPYLVFLVVGEVLNFMFKEAIKFRDIRRITLLGKIMQQTSHSMLMIQP